MMMMMTIPSITTQPLFKINGCPTVDTKPIIGVDLLLCNKSVLTEVKEMRYVLHITFIAITQKVFKMLYYFIVKI